jgi:hypothetical protein
MDLRLRAIHNVTGETDKVFDDAITYSKAVVHKDNLISGWNVNTSELKIFCNGYEIYSSVKYDKHQWVRESLNTEAMQPGDVLEQYEINLHTGEYRPISVDGKAEYVKLVTTTIPLENVQLWNVQVPVLIPGTAIPEYVCVLSKQQDQPNRLYKAKSVLSFDTEDDFPAVGDVTQLYYALDDDTQYYWWTGNQYTGISDETRWEAFMQTDSAWLTTSLDPTLRPSDTRILSFDGSYVINETVTDAKIEDESVAYPQAHGIQLIQEEADGVLLRFNPCIFFDACTHYAYDDGAQVVLYFLMQVRYLQ